MIDAVAVEIRKGLADWMNTTAFDAICNNFIKEMDCELARILSAERETLNSIDQDVSAVHNMAKRCWEVHEKVKCF